jgi:serine/threonine-protein kinase
MRDVGDRGRLARGTRLIGKYEIVRLLGSGGFGQVYEAVHLGLQAKVAIKILHSEARHHAQTLERFRREAWACAQLTSDHVVRVMDVDVLPDGSPFIVMELLRGRDLEAELARRGRMPLRDAVGYVLQAASAIAEAHARGIVHRDLKPNNLFIVEHAGTQQLKVLDFGLSKIASDLSLTRTSTQLGTPLYMSPEQFRSAKDADPRSDIWALGVILYRLLALRPPFMGETQTDVMVAIMGHAPPELRQIAPNVPAELAAVVMRTLRKDPLERYQSVSQLAAALQPFGPPAAFVAPLALASLAVHRPGTTLTDSAQDTPSEPRKSRLQTWTVSASAAVAIALSGFGLRSWYVSAATQALPPGPAPLSLPVAAAPAAAAPATTPPSAVAPPVPRPSVSAAVSAVAPSTTTRDALVKPRAAAPAPERPAKPVGKSDLGF